MTIYWSIRPRTVPEMTDEKGERRILEWPDVMGLIFVYNDESTKSVAAVKLCFEKFPLAPSPQEHTDAEYDKAIEEYNWLLNKNKEIIAIKDESIAVLEARVKELEARPNLTAMLEQYEKDKTQEHTDEEYWKLLADREVERALRIVYEVRIKGIIKAWDRRRREERRKAEARK